MKAKLFFFVIIVLLIAFKKGYLYIHEVKGLELTSKVVINHSVFDSIKAFKIYKKQVIHVLNTNNLKINNLQLLVSKENKIVKDKLAKQIEIIVFKNNQLNKNICNYSLQSVSKFQFYKTNFNTMLAENSQLIADVLEKHQAILKTK